MKMMRFLGAAKTLWFFTTVVFLFSLFFSLFNIFTGMDMSSEGSDCPFMSHEEVWCPMSSFDHLTVWRDSFMAIVPTISYLLFVFVGASLLVSSLWIFKEIKWKVLRLPRNLRERLHFFLPRILQEMFSGGILHPKLF